MSYLIKKLTSLLTRPLFPRHDTVGRGLYPC